MEWHKHPFEHFVILNFLIYFSQSKTDHIKKDKEMGLKVEYRIIFTPKRVSLYVYLVVFMCFSLL